MFNCSTNCLCPIRSSQLTTALPFSMRTSSIEMIAEDNSPPPPKKNNGPSLSGGPLFQSLRQEGVRCNLEHDFSQLAWEALKGEEEGGIWARVPLLPHPSRVVSRPNSIPLPFRTPAAQARFFLALHASVWTQFTLLFLITF